MNPSNITPEHKSPAISVIVPVYNVEKYIRRCLDSIAAQTFTDWECILIDDGSPDRCGAICEEYAAADPRFRVIHQTNGGVSRARQAGVDAATGEYTIHCDPDDWVEPNMLEELYRKARQDDADVVICDFYTEEKGLCDIISQRPKSLDAENIIHQMLMPPEAPFQQLHGSCWNKLVRRACYINENVQFPEGVNLCEDLYFCCNLFKCKPKTAYLPKAFYHYQILSISNSITQSCSSQVIDGLIEFISLIDIPSFTSTTIDLYEYKKWTLIKMIQAHKFKDAAQLYPEIHNRIIQIDIHYNIFSPFSYIVKQVLLERKLYANILYCISLTALKTKNVIYKLIGLQ